MAKLADIGKEVLQDVGNVGGAVLHGVSKVPRALANVVSVNPAGNALVSTLFPSNEQKAQIEDRRFAREQSRKTAKLNNAIAEERLKALTQNQENNQTLFKQQQTQIATAKVQQAADARFRNAVINLGVQRGQPFTDSQLHAIQNDSIYQAVRNSVIAVEAISNASNGHTESLSIARELMNQEGVTLKDGVSLEDAIKTGKGTFVFPTLDPDGPDGPKPAPEFTLHKGNFDQVYNFLIKKMTDSTKAVIQREEWKTTGAGQAGNALAKEALKVFGANEVTKAYEYVNKVNASMGPAEKINFSILHELNALKRFIGEWDVEEIHNSASMLMNLQQMSPDIERVIPAQQEQRAWEDTKVKYKGIEKPISLDELRQILSEHTPTYTRAMETLKQIGIAQEEQKKLEMDRQATILKNEQLKAVTQRYKDLASRAKSREVLKKSEINDMFYMALKNGDFDKYAAAIINEYDLKNKGDITPEIFYRYFVGLSRKNKDHVDATGNALNELFYNGVSKNSKKLPAGTLNGLSEFTGNGKK